MFATASLWSGEKLLQSSQQFGMHNCVQCVQAFLPSFFAVFAVKQFKIRRWKAYENTNLRKKRYLKSEHYSLINRVMCSNKSKSRRKASAFRICANILCNFLDCSAPILSFFFSRDSYFHKLSSAVF